MKKTVKIIALALVLVMAVGIFASCASKRLSGKYEATVGGSGVVMEFDKDKVNVSFQVNIVITTLTFGPIEGTYKIDGDKITLDFVDESQVKDNETAKNLLKDLQGELSFKDNGDTIEIAGVTYKKAK